MPVRIPNHLVFLHHPRTGGTATTRALLGVGGKKVGERNHDFFQATDAELTVCTLRDPYDVLASWFIMNPKYSKMSDFLFKYDHSEFRRNHRLFYFAEVSDIHLLYDDLEDCLNTLLNCLGLPNVRIPYLNATSNKAPYMEYYDEESISIVETLYSKDLEIYRRLK